MIIRHPSAYPVRPHTTASYARAPAYTSPGCKSRGRRPKCARAASLSRRRTKGWTSKESISSFPKYIPPPPAAPAARGARI